MRNWEENETTVWLLLFFHEKQKSNELIKSLRGTFRAFRRPRKSSRFERSFAPCLLHQDLLLFGADVPPRWPNNKPNVRQPITNLSVCFIGRCPACVYVAPKWNCGACSVTAAAVGNFYFIEKISRSEGPYTPGVNLWKLASFFSFLFIQPSWSQCNLPLRQWIFHRAKKRLLFFHSCVEFCGGEKSGNGWTSDQSKWRRHANEVTSKLFGWIGPQ